MNISIFAQHELRNLLAATADALKKEVQAQTDDYIKNVTEEQFIGFLIDKYSIGTITFDLAAVEITTYEADIRADQCPSPYMMHSGTTIRKDVVVYHLPFSGPEHLLEYAPSQRIMWSVPIQVRNSEVLFEIIRFTDDPNEIKSKADHMLQNIGRQAQNLNSEIRSFNSGLVDSIKAIFQARRAHFAKRDEVLSGLGVPIRRRSGVSSTFVVPAPSRRPVISVSRPAPAGKRRDPEPTLLDEAYQSILKVINDVGKGCEKLPSTYAGKREEALRDIMLLFLDLNFEGTATGETFNKSGKTDILLKYQSTNVFIAECKFWRGPSGHLDALTQMMRYLTWRDSKAAMVIFIKNKAVTSVLAEMDECTSSHPLFVRKVGEVEESWKKYLFHLQGDSERHVQVSVMLFHFPSS